MMDCGEFGERMMGWNVSGRVMVRLACLLACLVKKRGAVSSGCYRLEVYLENHKGVDFS